MVISNLRKSNSKKSKKQKKVKFELRKNKTKYFSKKKKISEHVLDSKNFKNLFNSSKNIVFLKKQEFDIWYDLKLKYPLMVAEPITNKTFARNDAVRRDVVGDSFRRDMAVKRNESFVEADYRIYMEYGGSMGHNAPAGYHKTNLDIYEETFLLSNVCPQEITFNAGVWVLLETWCKDFYLQYENKIKDMIIFTGSVKGKNVLYESKMLSTKGNKVKMNLPSHMFKIVFYREGENQDIKCFCVMFKNHPYYVQKHYKYYDMGNHLIGIDSLMSKINLNLGKLIQYYKRKFNIYNKNVKLNKKLDTGGILSRKRLRFQINNYFKNQLDRSRYMGKLIYSKTIEELEQAWKEVENRKERFRNIEFHREYYEMARARLK
jgi:DNA/RNA endonuclease G (NUC1)